jgi:hypothetical protein
VFRRAVSIQSENHRNVLVVPAERVLSASTRVHNPSKTGVNALKDALWRESRDHRPVFMGPRFRGDDL